MPAIKITPDGDLQRLDMPADTLPWLYREIGCDLVDVVRLPEGLDFWVNDNFTEDNAPEPNPVATVFAMMFGGLELTAPIMGTVIVATSDDQGNTVELSLAEATAAEATAFVMIMTLQAAVQEATALMGEMQHPKVDAVQFRWRFGDGTIRLTVAEAEWLLNQPGTPSITWPVKDNWAGPGFTKLNDESAK